MFCEYEFVLLQVCLMCVREWGCFEVGEKKRVGGRERVRERESEIKRERDRKCEVRILSFHLFSIKFCQNNKSKHGYTTEEDLGHSPDIHD